MQAVSGALSLKHFKSVIKNKSPLYYHHRVVAILNNVCPNQLSVMREAVRPQAQETPPALARPINLSLLKALLTFYPHSFFAFPALSLCGYVISLAKIINCHYPQGV